MVNYPRGIFSSIEHSISHQNKIIFSDRGMTLEQQINESNEYYLNHNIAVIHKKPTPIQIVKVDYPRRSRAVIKEAYFRQ
ncbi:Holliday junction resolvase RecU, partial [Lactobacillus crispatus]